MIIWNGISIEIEFSRYILVFPFNLMLQDSFYCNFRYKYVVSAFNIGIDNSIAAGTGDGVQFPGVICN